MNFRDLVMRAATNPDMTQPPERMEDVAARCGISRAYLYFLFEGRYTPKPWTLARIAHGLGLPIEKVERALAKSRREAAAT